MSNSEEDDEDPIGGPFWVIALFIVGLGSIAFGIWAIFDLPYRHWLINLAAVIMMVSLGGVVLICTFEVGIRKVGVKPDMKMTPALGVLFDVLIRAFMWTGLPLGALQFYDIFFGSGKLFG